MKSRRNNKNKQNKTKRSKSGKKWVTAITAAQKTLNKTGSFNRARKVFRAQALANARKLFGALPQKN
jgi:hypothetical protein